MNDETDSSTPIQNAEVRYNTFARERLTQSQLQRKRQKKAPIPRSDVYEDSEEVLDDDQSTSASGGGLVGQQLRHRLDLRRVLLAKKRLKLAGTRSLLRYSITVVVGAYIIQLVLAIVSLVGFGLHGQTMYIRHETTLGRTVGLFFEFQDHLPFQAFGYVAWVIIVAMTLTLFVIYYLFFRMQDVDPLDNLESSFVTAICLIINILPILNILPGMIFWVGYMMIFYKGDLPESTT